MAHLGRRLCHDHAKFACLGRLAKLETFTGERRPRLESRLHGTALSISSLTYHSHLLDPEDWVYQAIKTFSRSMAAGDEMCQLFVTKTFLRAVPWRSSRDGPPGV